MPPKRPPLTDADYRIVHGPWPRWALQLGLFKLMAWGAAVVAMTILGALGLLAAAGVFR
jgi:CHASE2 domain-containing sensor protein